MKMNGHDLTEPERRDGLGRWAWMALVLVLVGIIGTDLLPY